MVAVRHQRADRTPVDAHRCEIALPADRVQRVVGIGDDRQLAAPLHLHPPLPLVLLVEEGLVDHRRIQHGGVEDGVQKGDLDALGSHVAGSLT